jgi:adenylate cyclase
MTETSNHQQGHLTIMMADVTGSVSLYEALGDAEAHRRIVQCQAMMRSIVENNSGRVIEVIGDEIMCMFRRPESAVQAASHINHILYQNSEYAVGVRTGIHCGMTSLENDHPYGDTVNIAARMVGCARNSQIIISEQVYELLSVELKSQAKFFDDVFVKGKRDPYRIYQLPMEHDESTMMFRQKEAGSDERRLPPSGLRIRYRDLEKSYPIGSPDILIGRGQQCGLRVFSPSVSRVHANLSFHGGKILISDCSTNGTYILLDHGRRETDGMDFFVHHSDWYATWKGRIFLGEPISENANDIIYFECLD